MGKGLKYPLTIENATKLPFIHLLVLKYPCCLPLGPILPFIFNDLNPINKLINDVAIFYWPDFK